MKFELQTLEEYSDEAILAELHRVAESLKGQRLTIERFDSLARVHSTTLRYRFGSWTAALDRAGISEEIAPRPRTLKREEIIAAIRQYAAENPGDSIRKDNIADRLGVDPSSISRRFGNWKSLLAEVGIAPHPMGRRYSDEECFENLLNLWTHYGRQPHFAELKKSPSAVGSKAYVLRWGGWRAALAAFVKRINEDPPPSTTSITETSEPVSKLSDLPSVSVPRTIGLAMRYKILSRDKFRCVACGASPAKDGAIELHVDHIVPWSRGGLNIEGNLRTLCRGCNLGKGARLEDG